MMCNPNITPNGAEPTGSKTGSLWLGTNQSPDIFLAPLQKSLDEVREQVAKARNLQTEKFLREAGMPELFIQGVKDGHPGMVRFAEKWVRLHGYSFGIRDLNTMQFSRFGELVADVELFKISYEAPACG